MGDYQRRILSSAISIRGDIGNKSHRSGLGGEILGLEGVSVHSTRPSCLWVPACPWRVTNERGISADLTSRLHGVPNYSVFLAKIRARYYFFVKPRAFCCIYLIRWRGYHCHPITIGHVSTTLQKQIVSVATYSSHSCFYFYSPFYLDERVK